MSFFFKALVFFMVLYFFYGLIKDLFIPKKPNDKQKKGGIRIFKKGEVEKPKYDLDAETIEYEEVKDYEKSK